MRFIKPALTYLILPLIIVYLLYLNFDIVKQPIEFDEERADREKVAIQRLMDIRTLQEEYKKVNNVYTPSIKELQKFYNEGSMEFTYKSGSEDDSLAMVYTENVKKQYKNLKGAELSAKLYDLHIKNNDNKLVFSHVTKRRVDSCLFIDRPDFNINDIALIPFTEGDSVIMNVNSDSSLFQACMPYKKLLNGMDKQLIINLNDERKYHEHYEGLKVGDTLMNNLNAGNWESQQ